MDWKDIILDPDYDRKAKQEYQREKRIARANAYRNAHMDRYLELARARYRKQKEMNPMLNREKYAHRLATDPGFRTRKYEAHKENTNLKLFINIINFVREHPDIDAQTLAEQIYEKFEVKGRLPAAALPTSVITPSYKPRFKAKELLAGVPGIDLDEYTVYSSVITYDGEIVRIDDKTERGKINLIFKRRKDR